VTRRSRFLQPGHLIATVEPTDVTTILGSCVSVCLWDEQRRIGGLNHFMLPLASSRISSPRFGDVAMSKLLEELRAIGARIPFLQARVFGGSCMFETLQSETHLGRKNVELALNFLQRTGIAPVQVETGGNRGRKVIFRTDEGTACLTSI